MAANVTVLYPNRPDATFDMDYYLSRHMPLVQDSFGPHGMTGWRVVRFAGPPEATLYSVMATLDFGTTAQVEAAFAAAGGPVLADVPRFSNQKPVLMTGEVQEPA